MAALTSLNSPISRMMTSRLWAMISSVACRAPSRSPAALRGGARCVAVDERAQRIAAYREVGIVVEGVAECARRAGALAARAERGDGAAADLGPVLVDARGGDRAVDRIARRIAAARRCPRR